MSFLKNLEQAIKAGAKITAAVSGTAPIIGLAGSMIDAVIPGDQSKIVSRVQTTLTDLNGIIGTVGAFGALNDLNGEVKFKTAVPLVTQLMLRSDAVVTHGIKDEALFKKAMEGYTQATVDFLNSLKGDKV